MKPMARRLEPGPFGACDPGRGGACRHGADQAGGGPGHGLRIRRRVGEQDPDRLQRAGGQVGVDRDRVLHRERAGDQRPDLEVLAGQQVQEALQVAAFGPADVAGRVVDALQLVPVVVPARAVGPGEPDVEFLVVVGVPGQVELGLADVDHPGPVPGQLGRGLDRRVGGAARGQEDMVGTAATGQLVQRGRHGGQALLVRGRAGHRARLLGQPAASLDHVQPDDPDTGRDQQPDHQLADQAEADDQGGLAELRLGAAHALHGDGAHGGERGVFGGHAPRHRGAQVDRDPVVLGVQRELVAGRRDQLAGLELLGPRAHLDDHSAQRVAQRGVGVELVHHLLVGGHRALLRHRVQHLAHLVRPGPRLADHGQVGLVDLHHLGAGGDEREQRLDQDAAGPARRDRCVQDGQLPGLVVLGYLLHDVPSVMPPRLVTVHCDTRVPGSAAAISAWRDPRGRPARPGSGAAARRSGSFPSPPARPRPARR